MCFYAFCAIFPSFGKPDKRVLKIQANNLALEVYNVLKFEARKIGQMPTLFIKTEIS